MVQVWGEVLLRVCALSETGDSSICLIRGSPNVGLTWYFVPSVLRMSLFFSGHLKHLVAFSVGILYGGRYPPKLLVCFI